MISAKEIIEYVTPEIVIDIMAENGSKLYDRTTDRRTNQKCYWFQTICHGGDSHKLCYFSDSKDFYCYTSCGRMTFFDFICKIRNIKKEKFSEAVKYIALKVGKGYREERIGFQDKNLPKEIRQEIMTMDSILEKRRYQLKKQVVIDKFYDDKILNYFDRNTYYSGWIEDGISIKSMNKFGISWYEYQKHIIIPHYNIDGKLVGIRRRSLKPEDADNKYMPEYIQGVLYDHPLGLNLYGLEENKDYIKKVKRAIIVEGEKSVLLSDTYYGKKSCAVATCGFNISDWQLNTLLKLGVEDITLAFDKDFDLTKKDEYRKNERTWREFNNYRKRLKVLCERIAPYCNVYIILDKQGLLQLKDSPFDRGKEVFEKLMKTRKQITTLIG